MWFKSELMPGITKTLADRGSPSLRHVEILMNHLNRSMVHSTA